MPLLECLSPDELKQLVQYTTEHTYKEDELIIKEGDAADGMFILESGSARADIDGLPSLGIEPYKAGECFGELALMNNAPRAASVRAEKETSCFKISKQDFDSVLGQSGQNSEIFKARQHTYTRQKFWSSMVKVMEEKRKEDLDAQPVGASRTRCAALKHEPRDEWIKQSTREERTIGDVLAGAFETFKGKGKLEPSDVAWLKLRLPRLKNKSKMKRGRTEFVRPEDYPKEMVMELLEQLSDEHLRKVLGPLYDKDRHQKTDRKKPWDLTLAEKTWLYKQYQIFAIKSRLDDYPLAGMSAENARKIKLSKHGVEEFM